MLKRSLVILLVLLLLAMGWIGVFGIRYAHEPSLRAVVNPDRLGHPAFDLWGRSVTQEDAERMRADPEGRAELQSRHAVRIDGELLRLGRRAFYRETFGNEVFFTDVLGAMNGPLRFTEVAKAIRELRGGGTTNLRVALAEDAVVGGRRFARGERIDTGLDVARGTWVPLGMEVSFRRGRLRIGMTCAACHSTVEPGTHRVIEGAPNTDFQAGLLIALATNSAAMFANAEVELEKYLRRGSLLVVASDGRRRPLPDAAQLEDAVDRVFLAWPPGMFDSSNELRATPTQIPDSFTRDDHPYGWTGFAGAGPFRGLSVLNNNVHGMNSDKFADREIFHAIHGVDREVYVGTLLQNAAHSRFRYDPASTPLTPLEFFATVDPTPQSPDLNETVLLPSYPLASYVAPGGRWLGSPGETVWRQVNALSAFQNTLAPPRAAPVPEASRLDRGRAVFERADCRRCHDGPGLTNHRIVPVGQIGTQPVRAQAFSDLERVLTAPVAFGFDTPTMVAATGRGRVVPVPISPAQEEQLAEAWAIRGRPGGYKVKGLVGLAWTAPYLHDGGVAVGEDPETQLGLPGTLLRGVPPDPAQSLRALIDRRLRARVLAANSAAPSLRAMNVSGEGHDFWVDAEAGYTDDEQAALIDYLLHVRHPNQDPAER